MAERQTKGQTDTQRDRQRDLWELCTAVKTQLKAR